LKISKAICRLRILICILSTLITSNNSK
jgi:hypothetical protein